MTLFTSRTNIDLGECSDQTVGHGRGQFRQFFNGRFVLMRHEPRCVVCKSEDRQQIEELLFLGYSTAWVVSHLPPTSSVLLSSDGAPAPKSTIFSRFESHIKGGHSNVDIESGRAIQEYFAKESGLDRAGVSLVNALGVLSELQIAGYKALKQGDMAPPSVSELTKISTTILQFQSKSSASHSKIYQDAIVAIMEELQSLLDPSTMGFLVSALEARPEVHAALQAHLDEENGHPALAG